MKIEEPTKNKKKIKGTERILTIWAIGYIIIILTLVMQGIYSVSVKELSGVAVFLLVVAFVLDFARKHIKKKEEPKV